jgi:hypothetical protein
MRLRSTVLAFAVLLLIGHLASAAQTSTPADPASANLAAIFSAPVSPDGANAKLPSFEPTPSDKAGLACGSCSNAPCVGAQVGTVCKVQNGQTYTCQHAYVICTFRDCECWTGPLP